MFSNYFKIAFRSLWKNKGIAAINVVGLSVGLACFALFLLHVVDERSFDRFHAGVDRLHLLYRHTQPMLGGPETRDPYMPMPLGPALQADFPDVLRYTRLREWGEPFVRTPKGIMNQTVFFADSTFFTMFSFPLDYGNAAAALAGPGNVVLSRKKALELFGEENPLGRTLEIKLEDQFEPFTVTGVARPLPSNSTLKFDILLSFEKFGMTQQGQRNAQAWNRSSMLTFVELRPGSGLAADSARMARFWLQHHGKEDANLRQSGAWKGAGTPATYGLLPMREVHTNREVDASAPDPQYAWILLGIGGIILLIACINFTTLAIGRSAGRAREIGVRKVIGASRRQLTRQFLMEALLLTLFSAFGGFALAAALLPLFNELAGKTLAFDFRQFPELWVLLPALALLVGLLAGSYPAFVLSRFSPVETLKSKVRVGGENWFTRSLVTFQFMLSVGLIISTLVMLRQLQFLRSQNPGFDKENVVMVNAEGTADPVAVLGRFRQSLEGRPEIRGIAATDMALGKEGGWSISGWEYQGQQKSIYEYYVDPQYIDVLDMKLLAGRNFDAAITADTVTSVIINESAARDFGWTVDDAVGRQILGYNSEGDQPVVIGLVRDFHYRSMRDAVKPMLLHMYARYRPQHFFVRLAPGDPGPALERLRESWSAAEAVLPFRYQFLDDNLARFYEAEQRWGRIVGLAGGISIFLACLGLLGLAALSTVNRTKEIGIRKVLGASVSAIVGLLARDFLRLVALAIVLAAPLAWYLMQRWLTGFATRIELGWWMFAAGGLAALLVAGLTVSLQSMRAALADPVNSLKSE